MLKGLIEKLFGLTSIYEYNDVCEKNHILAIKLTKQKEFIKQLQKTLRTVELENALLHADKKELNQEKQLITEKKVTYEKLFNTERKKLNKLLNKYSRTKEQVQRHYVRTLELDADLELERSKYAKERALNKLNSIMIETLYARLDYVCFGSILPKALRVHELTLYKHLYTTVDLTYYMDRYGNLGVSARI